MNEKDLKLGKEYWLGEAKKYKGIYRGNFGYAHYFQIPFSPLETFTRDANGYVEFPLRGVFEIENWKFTTPIAMKCTKEQFDGIKDRLVEMGYKLYDCRLQTNGWNYITNSDSGDLGCICSTSEAYNEQYNRTVFETFNPDLFLALAAMTDKTDGIKGEWWRYTDDMHDPIVDQKYLGEFTVPNMSWRKATAQEIIEHFEKKENAGSLEFTVKVDIDAEKVAEDIFRKFKDVNGYGKRLSESTIKAITDHFESDNKMMYKKYNEYNNSLTFISPTTGTDKIVVPIPSGKQAKLFDDRVEITDWKPKEGEKIWVVLGTLSPDQFYYRERICEKEDIVKFPRGGFIKRTESEAKLLVEKLKSAML